MHSATREIHTGRLIAYAFAIVGLGGCTALAAVIPDTPFILIPAAFFVLGAAVGIRLILRQQRLIRIDDDLKFHWMLTWPDGGGRKVEEQLRQWLDIPS